jgi:hypothetical protein
MEFENLADGLLHDCFLLHIFCRFFRMRLNSWSMFELAHEGFAALQQVVLSM